MFGAMAAGFYIASEYVHNDGASTAFTVVAMVMGVLAAGSLVVAILQSFMPKPPPPPQP
jgi:hypothetical protein